MFIIKRIGFGILYVRVRDVCVYLLRVCTPVRKKIHACVYVYAYTRRRVYFVRVPVCACACGWNAFDVHLPKKSGKHRIGFVTHGGWGSGWGVVFGDGGFFHSHHNLHTQTHLRFKFKNKA